MPTSLLMEKGSWLMIEQTWKWLSYVLTALYVSWRMFMNQTNTKLQQSLLVPQLVVIILVS